MTIFQKYRRKPVIVEAVQWHGGNGKMIVAEILATGHKATLPVCPGLEHVDPDDKTMRVLSPESTANWKMTIETLEGPFDASVGDYICRGVKGEYWPVKPDVFNYTNELEIDYEDRD